MKLIKNLTFSCSKRECVKDGGHKFVNDYGGRLRGE